MTLQDTDHNPEARHEQAFPHHLQSPGLDRYDRLEVLERTEGFLPVSQRELTEAMSLGSFSEGQGGAAKHLAEVAIHQGRANTKDPGRALRKITREYIGYGVDAKFRGRRLQSLGAILSEINPELRLDLTDLEPPEPGLLEFMRWFDLSTIKGRRDIFAAGYNPLEVKYVPTNPGIVHYLKQAMEVWKVGSVRQKLPDAILSEASRFLFWREKVGQLDRRYASLRPLTTPAIKQLDE